MYCKNCGKHLKEGTRFCDRCGQSVRKSSNSERAVRRQSIEVLKEERLNRQKRLAEQERLDRLKKNRRKKRLKKHGGLIAFIIFVIIIAIASIIISYSLARSDSKENGLNNLEDPAASVQPVASVSSLDTPQTGAPIVSGGDYREFEVGNTVCPYPSNFARQAVVGNEKLSLTDSAGDAVMTISQESGVSDSAAVLMKKYADLIGANPKSQDDSRAGSNGYYITLERNGTVYHRKCILSGSMAVYYDFQYSSSSVNAAAYKSYIEYIDSNFTVKK